MDSVIVEPLQTGWAVRATGLANDLVFASGRAAERCARQLAECFARAGREAELQLRLRGGARAARFLCLPPLEHETNPLLISAPPLRAARPCADAGPSGELIQPARTSLNPGRRGFAPGPSEAQMRVLQTADL